MRKIIQLPLVLFIIFLMNVDQAGAQSTFSTNDLSVFYPAMYDPTQHSPSFSIQNEPVVDSGLPLNWQLVPSFYNNINGKKTAAVYCGKNIDFYGTGEVTG